MDFGNWLWVKLDNPCETNADPCTAGLLFQADPLPVDGDSGMGVDTATAAISGIMSQDLPPRSLADLDFGQYYAVM